MGAIMIAADTHPRFRMAATLYALSALVVLAGCGSRSTKIVVGSYTSDYRLDLPAAEKTEPNSVGLVFCLDTSGSMSQKVKGRTKIEISKEAMRKVFDQVADYVKAHPKKKVKVGVCSFTSHPTLQRGMESFDQEALEKVIAPLEAKGGTAIGDAIAMAANILMKSGTETRAIIVMTDGENTHGVPPDRVVHAIKQNLNNQTAPTADIEVFLVAFDINAQVFDHVKQAGAAVKESWDQASLESMLNTLVEEVLLEKPK
jgi:Mg-chelatase subunit ChlD